MTFPFRERLTPFVWKGNIMNLIVNDIKEHLNAYEESRLIVTGLDRSGKSTFLNRHFSEFKLYHSTGNEWYDIRPLYHEFRTFDRYPSIENYVYLTEYGECRKEMLEICRESLQEFENSYFVFFLWPRYRNMRSDYLELSAGDQYYSERYLEVADMILSNIKDSTIIEILPNLIRRRQNDECREIRKNR